MTDRETGLSRCFGFVSMKDQNAASNAITELNGSTFLCPRPLFVTYAMRKDARRQGLEERNKARNRGGPMGMGNVPPMGGFLGGPGAFNNLNMPFMRQPHMGMMNNNMGGMNPMRQMGVPAPMNQMRQPRPLVQRQMMQNPMPPQQMQQQQQQQQPPVSFTVRNLSNMLNNLNPEQQKNLLGERLYNYIVRSHPDLASKITGMLLEMDNAEILNMLDTPSNLDAKVKEALDVLNRHASV
ncbi:hypothetical protein STCU_09404 [Strigomonas culicis]|uniref:Polyadenylate-binding protein n=1 Tax=Strigomonas culicis TaxID=28005 RepID=S9V989_9TRYP|nr:hypothetical protein STCU_09404 [Strigomonas culicis]|eukprot:EPY19520.1 hypothetical protein STCU_09404 [Strigomonas culicis]